MQIWLAALAAPVLFAGALAPLQTRIDAETQSVAQEKEELLLRSGWLLRKLSLGYEALLADVYWTRAVQYYGGKSAAHDPHFDLLAPLLDLTTALDPHLVVAYRFGAIFLAEPPPKGAGRPDLAAEFIRGGIAANPGEWRLWADLGFLYYWDLKDYAKAAETYLQGSRQPGAHPWMKAMAARIAQQGGSRQTSQLLWSELYDSTADPNIRRNAFEHLQTLKAEEDAEQLGEIVHQYQVRFAATPASVGDLVRAGLLPGSPVDPAGYPYVLGPGGKVLLHPSSPIASDILKSRPR